MFFLCVPNQPNVCMFNAHIFFLNFIQDILINNLLIFLVFLTPHLVPNNILPSALSTNANSVKLLFEFFYVLFKQIYIYCFY